MWGVQGMLMQERDFWRGERTTNSLARKETKRCGKEECWEGLNKEVTTSRVMHRVVEGDRRKGGRCERRVSQVERRRLLVVANGHTLGGGQERGDVICKEDEVFSRTPKEATLDKRREVKVLAVGSKQRKWKSVWWMDGPLISMNVIFLQGGRFVNS
eukprot:Gb_11199 [translate_table: standard]